jgi:small subunit ribosomal protein S6
MNRYETVIIFSPVLTAEQAKDETNKCRKVIKDTGAKILHEESWGDPQSLAGSVLEEERWKSFEKKSTGYYRLFEYEVAPAAIKDVEIFLKRSGNVIRFLTVRLDQHS